MITPFLQAILSEFPGPMSRGFPKGVFIDPPLFQESFWPDSRFWFPEFRETAGEPPVAAAPSIPEEKYPFAVPEDAGCPEAIPVLTGFSAGMRFFQDCLFLTCLFPELPFFLDCPFS